MNRKNYFTNKKKKPTAPSARNIEENGKVRQSAAKDLTYNDKKTENIGQGEKKSRNQTSKKADMFSRSEKTGQHRSSPAGKKMPRSAAARAKSEPTFGTQTEKIGTGLFNDRELFARETKATRETTKSSKNSKSLLKNAKNVNKGLQKEPLPTAKKTKRAKSDKKLRIISLGGLSEIGKNITVFEYDEDIVIIDAGLAFPDEDMPGIDLVIPDFTYLVKNAHKVKGILLTHGHEDHIGGVPYLLQQITAPVYGTRLTLGILEGKLDENPPPNNPELYTVEASDVISLGVFKAEFIHVNHSIADACAIALRTPVGTVFHSGDFKLDVSPIDGRVMDLSRIGEIGKEGVKLLLCESTNAERAGFTPSERTVGNSLDRIFMYNEGKRIIIATFSSNVHRVQQIINSSAKYGRKVAVLGRSMVNVIGAACELGYMELPDDVLIDVSEIKKYPTEQITLITTGSQGEPMSALYRIAFSEHDKVKLTSSDVVVLSSSAIPGNEKLVGKIINALVKCGVKVVNDSVEEVHVSGHACREEIKLLMALLQPQYFMPIHGEERHLFANKEIAEFMGIPASSIFISEIGKVLEVGHDTIKFAESVPAGKVLVDGSGVGDIGSAVLRDRKHLAEDGLVVVVASVDIKEGLIISGPDIVSRGFVYVKESSDLMDRTKSIAYEALERNLNPGVYDFAGIKGAIKDAVAKFIFKETKRKPMILPVVMDV